MKQIRGVVLSEDEVVIREYEASKISNPATEGYLVATNRRLIFTGNSKSLLGNSLIVRDTKIEQITGFTSHLARGKKMGQLIFGGILAIIGLIGTFSGGFGIGTLLSLLILGWGGFILYNFVKFPGTEMVLQVMTNGQTASAIQVAVESKGNIFSRFFGLGGNNAWLSVAASGPGRHTEEMIREIGALVQDIQIMGDHAIGKWNKESFEKKSEENYTNSYNDTTTSMTAQPKDLNCDCGEPIRLNWAFCGKCGRAVESKEEVNIFS